jgi:hypothetical protein
MVYVLSFHWHSTVEKSKVIFSGVLDSLNCRKKVSLMPHFSILHVCGDIGQQIIISFMNIEQNEYLSRDNTDDIYHEIILYLHLPLDFQ